MDIGQAGSMLLAMSSKFSELTVDERIQLAEDLWDSVAADQSVVPLTAAQRCELDRRLESFERGSGRGRLVDDVVKDIRERL